MRRLLAALGTLTLTVAALAVLPTLSPAAAATRPATAPSSEPVKGIAITLANADHVTDAQSMTIANSLMSLISGTLHANAVSLNFPLFQTGSISSDPERAPMTPSPQRMVAITEVAEHYHLSVQWRPYLYEGDLKFDTHNSIQPLNVAQWFQNYWLFLRPYLQAANLSGVASFSIAMELRSMLPYLSQWTNLVRRAKAVYSGTILYSQQHTPQVTIPLTAQGYDAYQPIKLASPKEVSAAAFTRGFERNLRIPASQSSPADLTLEEVGITATANAYLSPASSATKGQRIDRRVQRDWFDGACNAFWALHLAGIYFYSIAFDHYTPGENDSSNYGAWLGTETQTAVASCFERTAQGPLTPLAGRSNASTPTVDWDPATPVEPTGGHPTSVSCPTTTLCVAVDHAGAARVETDGAWAAPSVIDAAGLTSVSCASATLCVAVDDDGGAVTYDGTAWSAVTSLDTDALTSVSCPSGTTTCVAVSSSGSAYMDRAGTWSGATTVAADPLTAVSCGSVSWCVAVDAAGNAYRLTSSWTGPVRLGTAGLTAISCPDAGYCVAGDDAGRLYRDVGGLWRWTHLVAVPGGVTAISCASDTTCAGVGRAGVTTIHDGLTWSQPAATFPNDAATSISCVATGACTAVSYGGLVATSASWAQTRSIDPRPGSLTAVSCGSSTFCVAVDDAGDATTWSAGTWSPMEPTGLPTVAGISCAGAYCMAVSNSGEAVALEHGVWGHAKTIDKTAALTAVSCTSEAFCAATDASNRVLTFNGLFWSKPVTRDNGAQLTVRGYTGISCASPTFCVAVDTNGVALVFGDGSYSLTQADTPGVPITGISCPTTTFCVGVDVQGREVTYDGSGSTPTWSLSKAIDPYRLTSVSCTAAQSCLATDDAGGTVAYDDGTWAPPSRAVPLGGLLGSVSCAGTGTCAVTGLDEAAVGDVS